MVGRIYDCEIENRSVARRPGKGGSKDILFFNFGVLAILVMVLVNLYVPNQIRDVDQKLESSQRSIDQLRQENEVLRVQEAQLTSNARLESEALRLGLAATDLTRIHYVDGVLLNMDQRGLMAYNRESKPGSNRKR